MSCPDVHERIRPRSCSENPRRSYESIHTHAQRVQLYHRVMRRPLPNKQQNVRFNGMTRKVASVVHVFGRVWPVARRGGRKGRDFARPTAPLTGRRSRNIRLRRGRGAHVCIIEVSENGKPLLLSVWEQRNPSRFRDTDSSSSSNGARVGILGHSWPSGVHSLPTRPRRRGIRGQEVSSIGTPCILRGKRCY